MKRPKTEDRRPKTDRTTSSYQVERRSPKGGWETLAPTVASELEGITLLDAQRLNARYRKTGEEFRLVKTTRSQVRA
ncbi:MAG: hypothetical protein NTY01_08810 [Verrucomicrobia bacterium]|nr:hypothetical protein [Verrucomicrobiota bacterium]